MGSGFVRRQRFGGLLPRPGPDGLPVVLGPLGGRGGADLGAFCPPPDWPGVPDWVGLLIGDLLPERLDAGFWPAGFDRIVSRRSLSRGHHLSPGRI